MILALFVVLAATGGVVIALASALRAARRDLAEARARADVAEQERDESGQVSAATITALEGDRDELARASSTRIDALGHERDELAAASASTIEALEQERAELAAASGARIRALEQGHEELVTATEVRVAALEQERDRAVAAAAAAATAGSERPAGDTDDDRPADPTLWPLLLARVERQWADSVAAQPDERGVVDGKPAKQFEQALDRELQRLREEVGVDASLVGSLPELSPAEAASLLLAVAETAASLAASAETVRVELGATVAVVAEGTGDEVRISLR